MKWARIICICLSKLYVYSIHQQVSHECSSCSAGTGKTCSPDVDDELECYNYIETKCKVDGVKEGYEVTRSNGCENCKTLRGICSSSCNYCNSDGLTHTTSLTTKKSVAGNIEIHRYNVEFLPYYE